ncbi:MAG: hypothetical protein ACLQEQ_04615 [Nitrososphaerales archaeon]
MSDIFDLVVKERELLSDALTWRGVSTRSRFSEYAKIELTLIERFIRAKSAAYSPVTVEVEGFVSRVGGKKFILRPSLAVNFGILCEAEALRSLPSDYEFVHVKGNRIVREKTSRLAFTDRLQVTDFERIQLPTDSLKPELPMKDAAETLMSGYVDPPAQLTRNLLISLTSSPGETNRVGGLTSTLMPLEERYSTNHSELLEDIKKSIPSDLTAENRLRIKIEGAGQFIISPFPWSVYSSSASTWDSSNDAMAFSRTVIGPTLQETTIGFVASSVVPRTLDEVWLRQSDFPMLVDKEVQRYGDTTNFDLELAKYFISVHINHPHIENTQNESFAGIITRRLIKLRRDYDSRGYSGLVSLDTSSGSPRSVLAIAKAIARGDGTDTVSESHVRHALAEFVDSREDLFETWAELGKDFSAGQVSPRIRLQKMGKTAERLYVYLSRNPNSSRSEMREAMSRVQDRIFSHSIEEMLRQGLIYRSSLEEERFSVVYESF